LNVAVTALGAVSSLGRGAETFYRRLRTGESGIRRMTPAERGEKQALEFAPVDSWSPQPEISAMKARRLDRGSQFAVVASLEAVRQAGYPVSEKREQLGIALGTGSAGAGALTEFLRVLLTESPEAAPPFHFANTIANAPASQVSLELKFFGPNATITQKDPSALNALIYAVGCLRSGRAEAMIAGGVDEWNQYYSLAMDQMHALRGENRPSGIVQGEGCYVVFLEAEEAALARGTRPLARVAGFAFASAPAAPFRFVPDEGAAEKAMRGALQSAETVPEAVDLLLPSRNGRVEMEEAEANALCRILGARPVETIAVKESLGEMAAAGGAQLVAAVCRMNEDDGPHCALINSFGAGGNFISAVLERA
jgi:3-oxoacyl-[acyl-carrier-protein] synthase II